MEITKGIINKEIATTICPAYVKFTEGDWDSLPEVMVRFDKLKRGQKVITFHNGQFVQGKISSINHTDFRAVDGPVVRFSNGEYSWRVDGNMYAVAID